MKFAKTIAALCVGGAMLFALPGCDSFQKASAYETFKSAYDKTNALEQIHETAEMDFKISMGESVFAAGMDMEVKATQKEGKIDKEAISYKVDYLGQTIDASAYIDGNTVYTNAYGTKMKMPLEDDSQLEIIESLDFSSFEFTEEMLKEAELKEENKIKTISVTIDGNLFKEKFLNGLMDSLHQNDLLEDYSDAAAEISKYIDFQDITVGLSVDKNGYLSEIALDLTIDVSVPGNIFSGIAEEDAQTDTKISISMNVVEKINNPGEDVVITPPEDLDTYTDYSDADSDLFDEFDIA